MSPEDVVNGEALETERQSTLYFEKRHAISPRKQLKCIGSHHAIHPQHFRFRLHCSLRTQLNAADGTGRGCNK